MSAAHTSAAGEDRRWSIPMRFEERELKPYAEPVSATELKRGSVYFSVTFVDNDMHIPIMQPLVFVGKNFHENDTRSLNFQDIDSYQQGICYDSATDDDHATFFECSEGALNNIFEYEHALEVLMLCSLRRRGIKNTR
jgi:hypothetical protein